MPRLLSHILSACLLALAATAPSKAAPPSATDLQALRNFELTPSFLERYYAYEDLAVEKPCELSPLLVLQDDGRMSLDDTVRKFESRPGVEKALAESGLTGRELLLGTMTLMGAAMQELAAQHPDIVKQHPDATRLAISDANMAFYKAHQDELHRHMAERAQKAMAKRGGKLPPCMRGQ
ncbi:hypothetical protein ERD78_17375 [Allopusillimonas soli]|uniref:Uncharacterized protein n=1 Tax=Allopusillimonas soli TaxID=659016 RepID=A0A853FIH8_9BURK|nr:hypothetical protein [Allopusillimonas soli]NYT38560.1 hypothetical protein [Allopusillimonas soli]TEA71725.1 hypothetical protein ERD78_17375 [Allopusillimonas soli]